MSNLQELHDFYLSTKPKTGKVQAASSFLVRLCKHLNVDSPEEITPGMYTNLPEIIGSYYSEDFHKAIQDKSLLAEMIGRYGPREGWEKVLAFLLNEDDENLRQFSFQSLEFSAKENPKAVMPYIEKYKNSNDELMRTVAARIMSQIFSTKYLKYLESSIEKWSKKGEHAFIEEIRLNIQKNMQRNQSTNKSTEFKKYFKILTTLSKDK